MNFLVCAHTALQKGGELISSNMKNQVIHIMHVHVPHAAAIRMRPYKQP